ncbi:MAG: thiol reductase thioredoxin [Bacteroidetes bacterium]|nr:MAG: thiol reductase thioredoxin [Bacteroidota bacterium]
MDIMKKVSLAILAFILVVSCGGQQINQTEFDEKAGDNILIGQVDMEGFELAPFNEWFDEEFDVYQVDDSTLSTMDKDDFLDNVRITMVLGTWCGDSRREVPRFYKILESLEYDLENMTVICVNTSKTAEGTNVDQLNIQKVPTIIYYKDEIELGRIIESPQESLEKDMSSIVK